MFSEDAGHCVDDAEEEGGGAEEESSRSSLPVELLTEALVACREAELLEEQGAEVAEIALHQWSWLHGLSHLDATGYLDEGRRLESAVVRALQLDFGGLGDDWMAGRDLESIAGGRSEE
jgi:hypothetical protein